jgi:nicotinamide-nucleotide amidase
VFVLPGVPWEMEAMLHTSVLPTLAERVEASTTVSKEVLVVGLGESHTHVAIKDLVEAQTNPTIAYLAGKGQVRVRVTAKAHDADAALALIAPVEDEIRLRLGDAALEGEGTLAERLGKLLGKHSATLAVAESLTGGLLAAELTAAAGASAFFLGGIVSYATESKIEVVGVPASVIEEHGPVSDPAARALAEGVAARFGARLGLATTGVAGPEPHDGHPPGTVFVGAHLEGRSSEARLVRGYGDRANVQAIAVTAALDLGRRLVERAE